MALNNPFSFASDSELQPFWNSSDMLFGDSYELIDALSQTPAVVLDTHSVDILTSPSSATITTPAGSPLDLPSSLIYKWELPLPIKTHYNISSSSSYSIELDEALSLSPEEDDDQMPFIVPSPPSMPAHFYPSSSCVVDQNQAHYKRFREEYEADLSIDCGHIDMVSSSLEEDDPTGGFKLPASKSPIMEAMVVCALNGWGIDIVKNNRPTSTTLAEVVFRVTDFNRYYKISRIICSKQRPTDDLGSRIKSLRRWFVNFPKKKDRCENSFFLIVKPTIAKKVNEIIERNSRSMGVVKRRRKQ